MITIKPCTCGVCDSWWLNGVGHFVQGSGFTKDDAQRIADALNQLPTSHYADVHDFHQKFDLPRRLCLPTQQLDEKSAQDRVNCMNEELKEFVEAFNGNDIAGQADALVDLVYYALGTAVMMGAPWQDLWDDVHRANMAKERGPDDGSGYKLGIIKPAGWVPPQTEKILADHAAFEHVTEEPHNGLV